MQRKLAAIMVADVVEYSRHMGEDEQGTLAAFQALVSDIVQPQITENQGRIFKFVGDGLLAEFSSVIQAVDCSVKIQKSILGHNEGLSDPPHLQLRIGVNLGDVIVEGDDVYGNGVNVAARLETCAEQGGIAVSGTVYEHVEGKLDVAFEDQGFQTFKNITEPVHVYRLVPISGKTRAPKRLQQEQRDKPAIVVLPFENLSADPDQEYFCDGLTQDLTTELCRFSSLFVIAAKSAFSYKNRNIRAEEIGAQLNVQYILEGAIQTQGDSFRLNAQLIDAHSGHHLWARRFNKKIIDIFEIQEEMIQCILGAVAPKLTAVEREKALRQSTQSITAYQAFLRGTQHLLSNLGEMAESKTALEKSADWFQKAIDLDPNYARAWGWLAYTKVTAWTEGWAEAKELNLARAYAEKSVSLEPDDYDTHWALACVYRALGHFDRANASFATALELNGNDPDMLVEMSETLCCLGQHQEAARQIERAMARNPHFPDWYNWMYGWVLHHMRDYRGSIVALEKILNPNNEVQLILAADYIRLGETDAAEKAMADFFERRSDWTIEKERETLSYQNQEDEQHWIESLRKAGLPEA